MQEWLNYEYLFRSTSFLFSKSYTTCFFSSFPLKQCLVPNGWNDISIKLLVKKYTYSTHDSDDCICQIVVRSKYRMKMNSARHCVIHCDQILSPIHTQFESRYTQNLKFFIQNLKFDINRICSQIYTEFEVRFTPNLKPGLHRMLVNYDSVLAGFIVCLIGRWSFLCFKSILWYVDTI
jgi:hypothetical protein